MTNETLNTRTYEKLNTALKQSQHRVANADLDDLLGMLEDVANIVDWQTRDELQRELKARGVLN